MKKDKVNKIIERVELSVAPLAALLAVWDLDIGVYVAAAASVIISVLQLVKLFLKD